MKEFHFQTPGGEHVEHVATDEDVVFYSTPKGEDLHKILLLIEQRSRTTDETRRVEIIRELLPLAKAFQAAWNEDPFDLIVELFGTDEEEGK